MDKLWEEIINKQQWNLIKKSKTWRNNMQCYKG